MLHSRKKGWIALTLSLALGVSGLIAPLSAFADDSAPVSAVPISAELPDNLVHDLKGVATVLAPLENNRLLVKVNDMEVALNISEETLIIDTKTALPSSLGDLKKDDTIFVYYSAAMTRSLPPQSHAIAIVTGVEEFKAHAELFTVKEIISKEDGVIRALNKEGDLIVAFTKEIPFTPYKTKQMVRVEDIAVGTQLFIWYEIVAMSYPGQTGATQAVLIGQEEGLGPRAVYTPWAGAEAANLVINDKTIALGAQKLMNHNGHLMVPLATVAQSLGFKITWNGADRTVGLDDGTVKTTLTIGEDSYYKASSQAIGLTQSFSLGGAPTIVNGRTYVPASLFNLLYSDNEAVRIEVKTE